MSDYTLTFEQRSDYLYACLTGKDSHAASIEYWTSIAGKLQSLGLKKVLVHENLTGKLTAAEMFDVVTRFSDVGFLGVVIAVYDENTADEEMNTLGELIAKNRGAFIRLFYSLEEAEQWIQSA
jgi:hypothetical protein